MEPQFRKAVKFSANRAGPNGLRADRSLCHMRESAVGRQVEVAQNARV
jgi:hypothetical protein